MNPINTSSFRRDAKHLAQLMDMVNSMSLFNGQPVLMDALDIVDRIQETLRCYQNDLHAVRAEIKLKADALKIVEVSSR
jgi:hypothetical protein